MEEIDGSVAAGACAVRAGSPHPLARLEAALDNLAHMLSSLPAVPNRAAPGFEEAGLCGGLEERADWFPEFHCPFSACEWEGSSHNEQMQHLVSVHQSGKAVDAMTALGKHTFPASQQVFSVVNAAIACKVQAAPPVVSYCHDRRALAKYARMACAERMSALICCFCNCTFPWLAGEALPMIEWRCVQKNKEKRRVLTDFFGLSSSDTERLYGVRTYVQTYGQGQGDGPDMREEPWATELLSWTWCVPFEDRAVRVLSSPEDRRCRRGHGEEEPTLCSLCEVPVCYKCWHALEQAQPTLPLRCLANDMWTGYGSRLVYELRATYMEVLLASPCILSLVCFVLEVGRGNVLQEKAHLQRLRSGGVLAKRAGVHLKGNARAQFASVRGGCLPGARGNITVFPLPLEKVYEVMKRQDAQLPHSPAVLANAVRVVLKAAPAETARAIAQACVRRDVVVALIEDRVRRKHPAYTHLAMEEVRERAAALPVSGPLLELVSSVELDRSGDALRPLKCSTPTAAGGSVEEAFVGLRSLAATQGREARE